MLINSIFVLLLRVRFHLPTIQSKITISSISKIWLLLQFAVFSGNLQAQVKWRNDSIPFDDVAWDNMSTTFIDNPDKMITLVTAIPYNGIDQIGDNKALDLYFTSSYYRYQSNLSNRFQKLDTYDSSNVYFLTPGIFKNNADSFEYRVLKDGDSVIKPWSRITQFADSNFQLNMFKKYCGFLGGYHTTWDHFITVQVRRKINHESIAESSVYWKQIHPRISAIYTSDDLNAFLRRLKSSYSTREEQNKQKKWKEVYETEDDSIHHRAKTLEFEAGESNIILYLNASVYWKEALEYSLIKDGKTIVDWKPNDYDNDFIWLRNLSHGNYSIKIRFSKQRHNISEYPFLIEPFWYETKLFHYILIVLIGGFIGLVVVFILNKRKLNRERRKTEQLRLEQRAVRSQLNPHFTFNALNSIQSLMNQNKIKEANDYFTQFSSLLRQSIKSSEREMLPFFVELQTLEHYIKLEQLRFPFQYKIIVDKTINTNAVEVPSLLIQPLVENAIKHGVSGLQKDGNITISIKANSTNMMISIRDNGNGFNTEKDNNGYGLRLTKERLLLLNQTLPEQPVVMTIDSGETGTTITLQFTNWLS